MSRPSAHIAFILPLLLTLLSSCMGEGKRMLGELERLEALNRSDTLFTSDSAAQRLVTYYDRWYRIPTNRNRQLRMRAYYMLGSAYRDMGESPAALHYFDIATRQPDTTNVDSATAATLFRIYGQMATIYEQQDMYQDELQSLHSYCNYALKATDTLSYLLGLERMVGPYYGLDDTLQVLRLSEQVRQQYMKYGYAKEAAGLYPTAIYVSLLNGNLNRARRFMDTFEQESGLFDEQGHIKPGHEHYYYSRGLYAMGTGNLEDAEYNFRKLISYGYPYEAYKGLLSVYCQRKEHDSITKYVELTENALGVWMGKHQAEAIIHTSAMYRYERFQAKAMEHKAKANIYQSLASLLIAAIIIILLIAYISYIKYRQRLQDKEQAYRLLDERYEANIREYQQLSNEYQTLRQLYDNSHITAEAQTTLEQKRERIKSLEKQIQEYKDTINSLDYTERVTLLENSNIVKWFTQKTKPDPDWKLPDGRLWNSLADTYQRYMPLAYACFKKNNLSRQELFTSILLHLHFTTGEIALLLNATDQRISNVKKSIANKLLGTGDTKQLLQHFRDIEKGSII